MQACYIILYTEKINKWDLEICFNSVIRHNKHQLHIHVTVAD